MGLERFELSTPRLSSVCSNQLSYRPEGYSLSELRTLHLALLGVRRALKAKQQTESTSTLKPEDFGAAHCEIDLELDDVRRPRRFSRKEVIQPHLPIRLPCYDFTPVTSHSLRTCPPCGLAQPFLEQLTPMV